MLTLIRYGVAPEGGADKPPLRERAVWVEAPANLPDDHPHLVQIAGYPGRWLSESIVEPLVDLVAQHTKAEFDRFGEMVSLGGSLLPGGTKDIYRLPLLDGYEVVDEETYVRAWNRVCSIEQRIPEAQ